MDSESTHFITILFIFLPFSRRWVCKVFGKGYLTFRHVVGARSPRPRWNTSYPSAVVGLEMWQGVVIGPGDPAPTCSDKNFTHPS